MSTGIACPSSNSPLPWHVLYQAALFETDHDKIPQRIAEAESAILFRIRELFAVTSDQKKMLCWTTRYMRCARSGRAFSPMRLPPSGLLINHFARHGHGAVEGVARCIRSCGIGKTRGQADQSIRST